MKKFIIGLIAICISLPSITFAGTNIVNEATKNAWWGNNSSQNGEDITRYYKIETYEKYKFQYVKIAAATEIYKNGAKICLIYLQNNYDDWKVYSEPGTCKVFCKDGWYGEKCDSTEPIWCETTDLTNLYSNNSTNPYNYLDYINVFGSMRIANKDGSGGLYKIFVLMPTSIEKHKLIVDTVLFSGPNKHDIDHIIAAKFQHTLCPQGYKQDSSGSCTQTAICTCTQKNNYIENGICKTCPEMEYYNKDEGKCEKCGTGKIFSETDDTCVSAKPISRESMAACFKETQPTSFKQCVK